MNSKPDLKWADRKLNLTAGCDPTFDYDSLFQNSCFGDNPDFRTFRGRSAFKQVPMCTFVKGSPDPSHFIFETNVEKSRIRQRTTLNLNDVIFNRF